MSTSPSQEATTSLSQPNENDDSTSQPLAQMHIRPYANKQYKPVNPPPIDRNFIPEGAVIITHTNTSAVMSQGRGRGQIQPSNSQQHGRGHGRGRGRIHEDNEPSTSQQPNINLENLRYRYPQENFPAPHFRGA